MFQQANIYTLKTISILQLLFPLSFQQSQSTSHSTVNDSLITLPTNLQKTHLQTDHCEIKTPNETVQFTCINDRGNYQLAHLNFIKENLSANER